MSVSWGRCAKALGLALGWILIPAASAHAQVESRGGQDRPTAQLAEQPAVAETSDQPPLDPPTSDQPSVRSSLGMFGDPGDIAKTLARYGLGYSLTYIGETFGVVSGGQRRGAIYEGRLDAQFDLDLEKAFGWSGAALHANLYQIHGHGLSRYYIGGLTTTSSIEALSSSRLFELWFEQKLLDGRFSVRAGQLAADSEFFVSQYSGLFINATFGWPTITALNLPAGGPAYPLATPAIRVSYSPTESLTLMGAVFNGDPAGPGPGDPQINNRAGLEFRTRDPAFLIGEATYAYNQDATSLTGKVKLGAWAHLGRFDDPRFAAFDAGATSLLRADPGSSGLARRRRGNEGVYGIVDQLIYREPGTKDQGLGVFARVSASPNDRNAVSFYADGGLTYKGLVPGRFDDTLGVGIGFVRLSSSARGFDRDAAALSTGGFSPVRSNETLIEVTYQAKVVDGFTVQPDLQYVIRPGGTQVDPRSPDGAREKNALVAGLRATIRY